MGPDYETETGFIPDVHDAIHGWNLSGIQRRETGSGNPADGGDDSQTRNKNRTALACPRTTRAAARRAKDDQTCDESRRADCGLRGPAHSVARFSSRPRRVQAEN